MIRRAGGFTQSRLARAASSILRLFAFWRCGAGDSVAGCCQRQHLKEDGMIKQVVRLTVSLVVNDGQLEAFKSIARSMTDVSKAEVGTLGYEWFSSADGKLQRIVETYVDSSALEAHFMGPAVQVWVPKLAELCKVSAF